VVEAEAAVSSVPVVAAAEAGRSQAADARIQHITSEEAGPERPAFFGCRNF